jgi:hypothetical protein
MSSKGTSVASIFDRKADMIRDAVVALAKRDNVEVPQNSVIDALIPPYMFVVQALWVRRIDIAFLERFFDTKANIEKLLKNHDFDALIYTFRSINTNLYTQKTSKGRTYNLNKSALLSFISDVSSGKIAVISRQKTQPKGKNMKNQPKNTFASKLFNTLTQATTPTPKAQPKQPKVATPTTKSPKYFTVSLAQVVLGNFHRITLADGTKQFVWIIGGDAKSIEVRNGKRVVSKIAVKDIAVVEAYVRKNDR